MNDQLEAERRIASLTDESAYLKEEIEQLHNFHEIIGQSPAVVHVLHHVQQVAPTDATVLIVGETGTGKELFARALHAGSRRADKPLIKVNCAAIPHTLIESFRQEVLAESGPRHVVALSPMHTQTSGLQVAWKCSGA